MKWGKYLNVIVNRTPEWAQYYINYKKLKGLIQNGLGGELSEDEENDDRRVEAGIVRNGEGGGENEQDEGLEVGSGSLVEDGVMIHKVESGTKIISPERIRWCGLTDKERPDWEQEVVDALRSPMSIAFVNELNAELSKINTFFLKTSAELAERLDALPPVEMSSHAEIQRITADVGRVSSKLREFSVVNFTGTVKILKKHDKNSGASLRSVYVRRVLEVQPFHVQLGQIVRRVVGIREEVDRLTPTLDDSFMRISSIRPGFNRDLNNDIMVDVTVKKEALCVVVRNSGKEILAIRDEGSLSAHLVKAVLESGESTADAAIRGVQDTAGELVHLERRLGEFKSATRTNTVYDAYLLVSTGVDPNWSNPCNITKLWLSPEQALVSVQDNSSLRVIRSVLES